MKRNDKLYISTGAQNGQRLFSFGRPHWVQVESTEKGGGAKLPRPTFCCRLTGRRHVYNKLKKDM